MNLDGLKMYVSSTADKGVVGSDTLLHFGQEGARVVGRYSGGAVARGLLVGTLSGRELKFRYSQLEISGEIHGGHSVCEVQQLADGSVRIIERFVWRTRSGSGTNVFDEVVDQ